MIRSLAIALAILLVPTVSAAQAPPAIGPGTPCTFSVREPTTNTDGSPLTLPLLDYRFYLDPPPGGAVIGVSVPFFTVARSAMTITTAVPPAPPGTTATASVCKNAPVPITTGNHTAQVSVRNAGGESAATSPPTPFAFIGIPASAATNLTFQ